MGLLVSPKFIWTCAKEGLATHAKRSIISMLKMQCQIGYYEISEYFKLFDTIIKPILCYAAEIWGNQYSEIIETVRDQYCRKYLKLPANVAKVFVRGECGRRPFYIDYCCKCIKYWIKLIRMNTYKYPYQSYRMLRNLDEV